MLYDRIFEFYYELTLIPFSGIYDETQKESFYFHLGSRSDIHRNNTMYFGITDFNPAFFGLAEDAVIESCLSDYFEKYIQLGYSDFRTLGLTSFEHVALGVLMRLQRKYPYLQYGTTRDFQHFIPLVPYYKQIVYNVLKEQQLLNIYSKYLFKRNAELL